MMRIVLSLMALLALVGPAGVSGPVGMQQGRLEVAEARFRPAGELVVSSPVSLTVSFRSTVLLANWQWVGADGQPVKWLGVELPPFEMKPLVGANNTWVGRGAVPPVVGSYKVKVTARPAGSQAGSAGAEQSVVPGLTGVANSDEQPFTRGFAFARDRNLWVRSVDLKRDRAVTFFKYPALASMPAWSPDGRWIAYVFDRGMQGSVSELWVIRPDGTGARKIASGDSTSPLGYPLFMPDGGLLVCKMRDLYMGDVLLGQTWDLYRVDMGTGKLARLQTNIEMPAISGADGRMVAIRDTATSDSVVEQSLVVSDVDGGSEKIVVGAGVMDGLSTPAWSPDGSKIVFASRGKVGVGGREGGKAGLAIPMLHGGVWDLWVVDAKGGAPVLLSAVQEDLPYVQWPLDGSEVYFISPTGFWGVDAKGGPPKWLLENDTHSELSVFAPTPRVAQKLEGEERCFGETGECLRGVFLEYWEGKGGLAQFGFPISPELVEDGRTVQYMERARFEWHTENRGTEYEVLLGRMGADMADARGAVGEKPFGRVAKPASGEVRYFAETGHTLAAPLRGSWEGHGGLAVFGYPLSEAFEERSATDGKVYLVQYFERNRLEYHPENRGSESEVLLGLLGVQEYGRRYR